MSCLFPDSWDGMKVTVADVYRAGREGLVEEPFLEGPLPWLAWLQLLPILLEGRHVA